jgi:hypothetical protein
MPSCPNCSKPMAPGFLGSEGLVEGAKWYLERTRMGFGGEELAAKSGFGMVYIPGFRCRECKTLVLQYGIAGGLVTPPAASSTVAAVIPAAP